VKSTVRLAALAVTAAALTAGALGVAGAAQAAATTALTVSPLQGSWQFGAGNPADAINLSAPGATCATGSAYYVSALTTVGSDASVVTSGALVTSVATLGADLAVPAQTGSLATGSVQTKADAILPTGTSDIGLSAEDAAKPVGTVIASSTFSLVGACLNSSFGLVSSFVTPVDVSAATRAPKPADWPANSYYDNLQWSWDARATASLSLIVAPTTVHTWQSAKVSVNATGLQTGTVTIKDGSKVLTTVCINNGKAVGIIPPLGTKGAHSLTAVFDGSSTVKPASSAAFTVTVVK
jgi:hypothetical protein